MFIATRIVFIGYFLITMAGSVIAQDSHYNYPFTVQCPEKMVRAGTTVEVKAVVPAADEKFEAVWNWTALGGAVKSGQGTRSIVVDTAGAEGQDIHITVERNLGPREWVGTVKTSECSFSVLSSPVLIDEFSTTGPCEDGNSRMDAYFYELQNNPTNRGLIIIYESVKRRRAAWHKEQLLSNFIKFRGFDRSRITFIRGPYRDDGQTQLWRVPPQAEDPKLLPGDMPTVLSELPAPTKPYLWATEYVDGLPECEVPMYDLKAYAVLVNTEPHSRGRIVIGQSSRAKFALKQRELATELAANGVASTRLVFVYKYVRPNRALETIELWVVPARRG